MTSGLRYLSIRALAVFSCAALLTTGCLAPRTPQTQPTAAAPRQMTLSAGGATAVVESATGRVTSIRLGTGHEEMCEAHPASGDQPFAFVEITDLRTGRIYSPIFGQSVIKDWRTMGRIDGAEIEFTQQYPQAPFEVHHLLKESKAGIRWEAAIRLLPPPQNQDRSNLPPLPSQDLNRSLQVTWVLPVPADWQFWGPNDSVAHPTNAVTPYRYVYGHTDFSPHSIIMPLVGVWGRQGGAAVFSPPDVHKCQIVFEIAGSYVVDMPKGALRHAEDLQLLRVAYNMVGLRPDKELRLGICVAGTRPDWRAVLGHYVNANRELFEPIPQTRKCEGMYRGAQAGQIDKEQIARYRQAAVTSLELYGHFPRYGEYVPPGAIEDPNKTWICKPHDAGQPLSVAKNRQVIKQLKEAGIASFVYFHNVHAQPALVEEMFSSEVMRGEDGRVNIQFQDEPALHAQPDSPFGQHLLSQLDLLLKAYDEAPGVFLDDYSIQWVDFAHDDGVTMVHNRPAYDLNRNHQDLATICAARIHEAGKVTMANKLSTIESARGIDMVLLESFSVEGLKALAFACACRPVFPTDYGSAVPIEKQMQYLLIWGGLPAQSLPAYRPLTDALIGKRWIFDADPVTLPPGYAGQIFRIDRSAPNGGDVVVSMVNLQSSYKDRQFTEGLAVSIRLPEIGEITKATWISAERSEQKPEPCSLDRDGDSLVIHLPLVGAAGILRLSR